jgi:site-specific DNA-methyltransferase (adenine-specific)
MSSTLDTLPRNEVITGDARTELAQLPDGSLDMILTSPPYFRLRDYGVGGQLGTEPHVEDWVTSLRLAAVEMQRVLSSTGSLWLNLGDTFSTHMSQGAGRKSLLLGPERLALALVGDGWRIRNKIVWSKTNYPPTSATDRLACGWEAIYVFVKQPHYFFDLDAIRVPHRSRPPRPKTSSTNQADRQTWRGPNSASDSGLARLKAAGRSGHPLGKNPGDAWPIAPSRYRGSHHATFPVALAELAIRAGCPEARCSRCRIPWRRPVSRHAVAGIGETAVRGALGPACPCGAPSEPGLVCDPFFGAGTTALGAIENRRDWLGIELSPNFAIEAARRIAAYEPLRVRQTGGGP